jgi:hypothetical protein
MAILRNTMEDSSNEVCSVCSKPVAGGFTVQESESRDGEQFIIEIADTPDRDFNDCDACNTRVHFRCSKHPKTGYCDRCFEKYGLEDYTDPWPWSQVGK